MDAYLTAAHKLQWFSGNVFVARGGRVILNKGYGLADYELGVPFTPRTKFRLGSVTKQFTAMAVLQLEEKGLLKVADTVRSVFPDYPEGDRITIHHLLTHTAGIPNFTSFPDYPKAMLFPTSVQEAVDRFKNRPLDFPPGEKFRYSNSGYVLLGAIIEKVSGETYEAFLRENIFRPLGMEDSGYDHREDILKDRASGYEFVKDQKVNASYVDMSVPYAAGALYSTVLDLYKWDRALYTDKLVPQAALTRMFTPFDPHAGPAPATGMSKETYAYGWVVKSSAGHKEISHGGGVNGFATHIARFPDDDACVIVLNNFLTAHIQRVSDSLAALLFGQAVEMPEDRKPVKLPAAVLDSYPGRYQVEGEPMVFTVVRDGDNLLLQAPGQPELVLRPRSEAAFFSRRANMDVIFEKDASGRVSHFVLVRGILKTKAVRVEE